MCLVSYYTALIHFQLLTSLPSPKTTPESQKNKRHPSRLPMPPTAQSIFSRSSIALPHLRTALPLGVLLLHPLLVQLLGRQLGVARCATDSSADNLVGVCGADGAALVGHFGGGDAVVRDLVCFRGRGLLGCRGRGLLWETHFLVRRVWLGGCGVVGKLVVGFGLVWLVVAVWRTFELV